MPRYAGWWVPICVLVLGLCSGCETAEPANPIPPGEEQEEVAAAFRSASAGHVSGMTLEPAGPRGRWADVPNAIRWAIADDGVEMGLLRTRDLEGGYIFELVTVEGWPATLEVRRVIGPQVYEASASVGRFPEIVDRVERERALLRSFDDWMAALGAKLQPVPMDE